MPIEIMIGNVEQETSKAKRINKGKSLIDFPKNYTVIDIETTGLDPRYCDIIEIAALKISNNSIISSYNTLVKPDSYFILSNDDEDYILIDGEKVSYVDSFITKLTGITNEMLHTAPLLEDIAQDFLAFISDDILIGHNVNFDINFLYDGLLKTINKPLQNDFVDTMRLARRLLPELKHHRLRDLVDYFQINIDAEHRALSDCTTTNIVLNKLQETVGAKYVNEDMFLNSFKKPYPTPLDLRKIVSDKTFFDDTHPLYHKKCVFTGKLDRFTRAEAAKIVVNYGGLCENSVTTKTNFLIIGSTDFCSLVKDGKSSKQKRAEELMLNGLDIQVITEEVFYDLICDNSNL